MSNIETTPYIFFKGNCKEAMEFYKNVFSGELFLQTYGDVNAATEETPADYIMHASLSGGEITLMASDTAMASDVAKKVSLSLNGSDEDKLTSIFNTLCEGGDVQSPLKKEFWGDTFGAVIDKYGVDWMVNISVESKD